MCGVLCHTSHAMHCSARAVLCGAMQRKTMRCSAMPTVLCSAALCGMLCYGMLSSVVRCYAVLGRVLCCAALRHAMLLYAALYLALLCSAMLGYALLRVVPAARSAAGVPG